MKTLFFFVLVALALSQGTIVEYLKQDTGCVQQPVRIYTISSTCARGPLINRYGDATCNTTEGTGKWRNCAVSCLDPTQCTTATYTLGTCFQTSAPSGKQTSFKYACGGGALASLNMSIQLNYTEYQDSFCRDALQFYQQLRVGCVDSESWKCTTKGVEYKKYNADLCSGPPVAGETYPYGLCVPINGKYYKIWGCRGDVATPNAGSSLQISKLAWLVAVTLYIGLYTMGS
jgi:hypothetical protein